MIVVLTQADVTEDNANANYAIYTDRQLSQL